MRRRLRCLQIAESRAVRLSYFGLDGPDCVSINSRHVFGIVDRHSELPQQSVLKPVDPAVYDQFLQALPRTLDDRGAAHVQDLFDDIELTQTIETLVFITYLRE